MRIYRSIVSVGFFHGLIWCLGRGEISILLWTWSTEKMPCIQIWVHYGNSHFMSKHLSWNRVMVKGIWAPSSTLLFYRNDIHENSKASFTHNFIIIWHISDFNLTTFSTSKIHATYTLLTHMLMCCHFYWNLNFEDIAI